MRRDLINLRACGFNWLRAWATWGAYDTNVPAVTAEGAAAGAASHPVEMAVAGWWRRWRDADCACGRAAVGSPP